MERPGAYISDVNLLESLNDRIKCCGETMASIDQGVCNYLGEVISSLQSDLNYIQSRLSQAESSLSQAQSALNACHASQASAAAMGMMGPSCMMEESAVQAAQAEVEKWRGRYENGQQIIGDCEREIWEYKGPGGGHSLIHTMCEEQTPAVRQLLRGCVDRLQDVLVSNVGGSTGGNAIVAGAVGLAAASAANTMFRKFNMGGAFMSSSDFVSRIDSVINRQAIEKNNRDLEKAFGIKQGPPMKISEADMQSANPNYTPKYLEDPNGEYYKIDGEFRRKKWWDNFLPKETQEHLESMPRYRKNSEIKAEYGVNCATTSAAYALRAKGFDVTAKGNPEKNGNLNTWLSYGHSFDIWKNPDGSKATPMRYGEWMEKKGLNKMTPDDYKDFFEEECKDKGIYIVTTSLTSGNGHATILQRDSDGKLYFIEPQVFESDMTDDGRRNIDDLVTRMSSKQRGNGVLRVDDKIFDTNFAGLFDVNK